MVMYKGLARVAKRTGYPVVEVKGWKKRGYGQMVKAESVMCHHTAGPRSGNFPSLNVVTHGHSTLPGPLCNYGLGRDGTIYVVAAGRANHAGRVAKTMWSNTHSIGIEAENTGTGETWSDAQLDAYVRLCAELCKEFKWPVTRDRVVGHKEAAVPRGRKIDPNFSTPSLNMNQFRAYVKAGSYKRGKPSTGTASTIKPKPKPSKPAKPSLGGEVGGEWPNNPLAVDGKFWLITKRGYQRLLAPKNVGDYRGTIDGEIGPRTVKAEQRWLKKLGFYGRGYIIDGKRGPATIKALQRFLQSKGLYKGYLVDGKFQTQTIKALQQYLNSQRKHYK